MIGTLIANSTSFNEKTEYSQEKYIKKKEKKYFDFVQIKKPTIRLLAEIFYRQDPEKSLGLRLDNLSQIISYSGVNPTGNFLLYESGTSGLAPAAFLNSMGPNGSAQLIHLHPGNFPQKQAIFALNLSDDHLKKCTSVNLYSVLRQYYQGTAEIKSVEPVTDDSTRKRKLDDDEIDPDDTNPAKIQILDNGCESVEVPAAVEKKKQKWQEDNAEAIKYLTNKVDSLTIISKEDPLPILKELLPFVNPGRPVVMFHTCKEILMECYTAMKAVGGLISLRLTTNFIRNYQVLPMRTHPAVQIQGSSGWILAGYTVKTSN